MAPTKEFKTISARLPEQSAKDLELIKEFYSNPVTTPSITSILQFLIDEEVKRLKEKDPKWFGDRGL